MTCEPIVEELNQSDLHWRDCEYVDYVSKWHPATIPTPPAVGSVTRFRFALQQPGPFEDFAGRFADISLDDLGLDAKEVRRLTFGLATTGVRVPRTGHVLRVARPWYGYFHEHAGEFYSLPENWMECVRLVRCPGGGIEWLGRRHPMGAYPHFDFSDFVQMPGGWRRATPGPVDTGGGTLVLEWSRVLAEIDEFKRGLLPQMASRAPELFPDQLAGSSIRVRFHSLDAWQSTAHRLFKAVAEPLDKQPIIYNAAQFHDYAAGDPDPAFDIHNGRIRYLLERKDWDWQITREGLPEKYQPRDPDSRRQVLSAMKDWINGPLTEEDEVWKAMGVVLPTLAVHETAYVLRLLNPRLWHERIEQGTVLTEDERRHDPADIREYFHDRLGTAVAKVIRAMRANHFLHIQSLLNHPCLSSDHLQFLPESIFRALLAKAQIVMDLRLCTGYVVGPRGDGGAINDQ